MFSSGPHIQTQQALKLLPKFTWKQVDVEKCPFSYLKCPQQASIRDLWFASNNILLEPEYIHQQYTVLFWEQYNQVLALQ